MSSNDALEDSEQRAKQEIERKHDVMAQEPKVPHLTVIWQSDSFDICLSECEQFEFAAFCKQAAMKQMELVNADQTKLKMDKDWLELVDSISKDFMPCWLDHCGDIIAM